MLLAMAATPSCRRCTGPPSAPWDGQAATSLSRKQGLFFVQRCIRLSSSASPIFAPVDDVVVKTLADEHTVCDAEIDCNRNDDGHETSPSCTYEIADVAYEPDEDETEGDSFSGAVAVVFDQLWDLDVLVVGKWLGWVV